MEFDLNEMLEQEQEARIVAINTACTLLSLEKCNVYCQNIGDFIEMVKAIENYISGVSGEDE